MAGYFVIGTLAAFGAFCALWVLAGLFLPRHPGAAVVVLSGPGDEAILCRYRWLRGIGLVRCPIVFIGKAPCEGILSCTLEELTSLLEQERNGFDRA